MKKTAVLRHFGGSNATARALVIDKSSVSRWDAIIPLRRAVQIEHLTRGVLKVDLRLYRQLAA
jgi:transcriptional repressor of cell division inhibition gene dicB